MTSNLLTRPWHRGAKLVLYVAAALLSYGCKLRWMSPAHSFEAGTKQSGVSVLVASQGSEYKDEVVRALAESLARRGRFVRVVDVSALSSIDEREWDAFVLLHTWEGGKPEPHAAAFAAKVTDKTQLVVLTTSGSGEEKLPEVDAISSASEIARAPGDATLLLERAEAVLAARAKPGERQ